jgi:hypothetical protein
VGQDFEAVVRFILTGFQDWADYQNPFNLVHPVKIAFPDP